MMVVPMARWGAITVRRVAVWWSAVGILQSVRVIISIVSVVWVLIFTTTTIVVPIVLPIWVLSDIIRRSALI